MIGQSQNTYQAKGYGLQVALNQGPVDINQRTFKDPIFGVLYFALWVTSFALLFFSLGEFKERYPNFEFSDIFSLQDNASQDERKKFLTTIFAVIGISFVISAIFTLVTPYIAGCVIYGYLILVGLALATLAIIGFAQGSVPMGVFVLIFLALYCLVVYCMREKIRIAIVILKASSRFLIENPSALIVSLIVGIFWIGTILIHFLGVLINSQIYSDNGGEDDQVNINPEQKYPIITFIQYVMIYWSNFFCDLWLQLSLCFFVCTWFFAYTNGNKDDSKLQGAFCRSIWVSLRKHFGSISLGALILAICEIIKDRIESQSRGNPLGWVLKCICRCIIEWIKQFTKFAIVMIALTGDSFCIGASDGANIVMKNFGTYAAVQFVGDFYARLGALFIAALSGVIGYLISSNVLATFISILIGWCIAKLFLDIIQVATNASLFYIVVDTQLNGSITHGHPQYKEIESVASSQPRPQNADYNQLDTTRGGPMPIDQNIQLQNLQIVIQAQQNQYIDPMQQQYFQNPHLNQNGIGNFNHPAINFKPNY